MINKSKVFLFIISILIGIVFTTLFLDITNSNPKNVEWFNSYDLKSDYLAFKFFINDVWRFPVGLNPNYGEISNSIVFSGAVPILSFIFKLFKNFLPDNFHFFSIWIFLCFFLQFFFAYKIIHHLTKDNLYSYLSSIFFILSSILIYRLNLHLSLGAHWLILAFIYLDLNKNQKYLLLKKIFLIILSSLIHFYFTIILLIMNIFFSFFNSGLKLNYNFFKENFSIVLVLIFTMYIVGYFHIPATDALGFGYGYYKSNLLSFIDPSPSTNDVSWSIILPDIYNSRGEKEGFAYLGLGIILLIFFLFLKSFGNLRQIKINYKYLSLSLFFLLLAITNNINIGSINLLNLNLPDIIYAPLSIIRASGRLIWPVYYFIIIFVIYKFHKLKLKNYLSIIVILIFMQVFDYSKSINENFILKKNVNSQKYENEIWEFITKEFNNVSTTSLSNRTNSFSIISNFLIKNNFESTNYFRLGRYNREAASVYRTKFISDLIKKKIDFKKAYIIESPDHLRHLKILFNKSNHGFFYRDKLWFLLPKQKKFMTEEDHENFNSINFKPINVNDQINLIQNDKNGILGLGWSHSAYGRSTDNNGVWSEGNFSTLIFDLKEIKLNNINIILNKVFVDKNNETLIDIIINDKNYKNFKLDSKSKKIELKNINSFLKKGSNLITLNIKNPSTPLSRLESVDGRLLGILAEKVTFN